MYHLKLIKGLSYSGIISATQQKPDVYVDDEAIAKAAVASGYFRVISGVEEVLQAIAGSMDGEDMHHSYTQEALEDMSIDQLKEVAKSVGVVKTSGFKKVDYVNAILWAEGDYRTGSPTMMDLQEK